MARWHYRYAGLRVVSELWLPEWQVFECRQPSDVPDIEIRLEKGAYGVCSPILTATEYRFQIEGVGEYWVQGGRTIRVTLHPSAGEREARLFLLGSAWGALCYQRGVLALHTSVVEVNGQAVAFCGASGAGKSSVAAWLVGQGYRLIGDDLCHFDIGGTKPAIYPAAPRLKLWQDALDHLGWESDGLERDHFRMEKFHVHQFHEAFRTRQGVMPGGRMDSPVPLAAINLLAWGESGIIKLKGLAALRQLIESATYRGELLEPMGELAAHWQRCAALARCVPIFRFTRPTAWSAMAAAMQDLIMSRQTEAVVCR